MTEVDLNKKFVAVINKKVPIGTAMNALGHMTAGLVGQHGDVTDMRFDDYIDADGGAHKSISDFPFIILRADNSNKIRNLRFELMDKGVEFTDFTSTMTVGTYKEQKERTKQTKEEDLEYYGICMFGDIGLISELTKKFSLWRD